MGDHIQSSVPSSIQEKKWDSMQEKMQEKKRDSMQEEIREKKRGSMQKKMQEKKQDSMQKEIREKKRGSMQKKMQEKKQDSMQEKMQEKKQDSMKEEMQEEKQGRIQDNTQDIIHNNVYDEGYDRMYNRTCDGTYNGMHEKIYDMVNDSDILLREAEPADLAGIMQVMDEVKQSAEQGWFVSDDGDYVKDHIKKQGFIIVAEDRKAGIVGFMMVDFPGICEKNLGVYFNSGEQMLNQVVHMDSAAVLPAYRGKHLQEKMMQMAEHVLDQMPQYKYRMCTVHPDNQYSLGNLQRQGYEVLTTVYKYNGLLRHVMYKKAD